MVPAVTAYGAVAVIDISKIFILFNIFFETEK